MAAKGTLQINILGTSFSIQANEDSLYLDKLLQYYRSTVEDVARSTDLKEPIKIAVLAGIMITDELMKERQNAASTDSLMVNAELSEVEKRTIQMMKKLDQALN
ncbi:MAG: cell division protein ZapA [Treponemataceae bacterium]|nr:cell division protein ZapA [Treponemataceae bacterium]